VFGALGTWRLLQKTLALEVRGGLLVRNGSRKRTRGGTFLFLARQWCSRQEQARIFGPGPGPVPQGQRQAPPIARTVPSLPEAVGDLPHLRGGECRMKLTLIGRPSDLITRDTYVAFRLNGTLPPSLPKGLPKPPPMPLRWIVMVNKKQWGKVAESLARDPETKVIAEGYPALQGTAHVLLVTMATTTELQRAKAEAKAEVSA